MTDTTTRPAQSTTTQHDPAPQPPPSPVVASTTAPATLSVANNLSDDAILATEMLVAPSANSQALFANPFAADREEMLFVDLTGSLQWLTHDADDGWKTVDVKVGDTSATADEVVVAVHIDGSVWAFATSDWGLRTWCLEQRSDGTVGWEDRFGEAHKDLRGLQVQYLPERPARPVLLFLAATTGFLSLHAKVAIDAPPGGDPWNSLNLLRYVDADFVRPGSSFYYGVDRVRGGARIYGINDEGTLWAMHGNWDHSEAMPFGRADDLAGLWHSENGVGCIALHTSGQRQSILTIRPQSAGDNYLTSTREVDTKLVETSLWEDGLGRYHLYGMADGNLRIVHQSGVEFSPDERDRLQPVPGWESHPVTVNDETVQVAVSRPLAGSVDMYALDPFPDEYPSQHVMHVPGSVKDAERCVIMTQDVTTTWWSREVVRLPARKKPYKMKTHESRLTITSQGGAVVPNCPVTITADRAVDFRIGGAFYRCGPDHPVSATTDHAGTIRIATVAKDLIGCTIHVTAVGLPDGTSFNPVTPLHSFLGGNGTLPMHQDGISEDGLRDAKTSDDRYVFPAWHGETALAVIPTPAEMLDWCRHAYQATSRAQAFTTSDSGERIPLRGIVLQTWDTSRPAYEEVTTAERQGEIATARAVGSDEWDLDSIGDVFLAIGDGLVSVVETGVNFAEGVATVVVKWVEGQLLHLKLLWDQSDDPFQFIQAVVNELEGDVEDVLDWLSWVFDWDDIFATSVALRDGLKQVPQLLTPQIDYVRDKVVGTWFADQKREVHEFFAQAKHEFTGQTFDNKSKPLPSQFPVGPVKSPPTSVVDPEKGLAPKSNWMIDWMRDHADTTDFVDSYDEAAMPPEFGEAVRAFEDLLTVFEDDKVSQDLAKALNDVGTLVTNLFDATDLQSLARVEVVSFLDLLEDLVDVVLDLADAIVEKALTLIEKVAACITAYLDVNLLEDTFLGWLWEFLCDEAELEYAVPTLGDIFATAISVPFTVVTKALTGHVPFPDGFPNLLAERGGREGVGKPSDWVPAGDEHFAAGDYSVVQDFQCFMQTLVGIAQIAFVGVDFYMDGRNVAGSNEGPTSAGDVAFIAAVTFFDMFFFGVGDLPIFWGCNVLSDETDVLEGMWWGEYFCKFLIYAGDIVVAFLWPFWYKSPDTKFAQLLGTAQGNWGNRFITFLGLTELGFSIALCAKSGGKTTMAQIWLWSQYLSMLSSCTAWLRIMPGYPDNPELIMTKMTIDAVGDISAGFWLLIMAIIEDANSPRPVAIDWPVEVKQGAKFTGKMFATDTPNDDSEDKRITRFGPIGWRIEDPSKLPGLLELMADERDGYAKLQGLIEKDAAREEPYEVVITCANSYDPNRSTSRLFSIKVVE